MKQGRTGGTTWLKEIKNNEGRMRKVKYVSVVRWRANLKAVASHFHKVYAFNALEHSLSAIPRYSSFSTFLALEKAFAAEKLC